MARRTNYSYRRKRKPKYKNIIITLLVIVFLVFATPRVMLMTKGFSFTAANNILIHNIDVEYSESNNRIFSSKEFKSANITQYKEVLSYLEANSLIVESEEVTGYINGLIELEYTTQAIQVIIATQENEEMELLLSEDKNVFIEEMAAVDYFRLELFDEYLAYYKTFRKAASKIVLEVNMRINYEPFDPAVSTQYESIDSYDYLINHFNKLPDGYEPTDLVILSGPKLKTDMKLESQAADAYESMRLAALEAGHTIGVISAYRSFDSQTKIYNDQIEKYKEDGYSEEEAVRKTREYVAVPGHSEHQTGLALDWYLPYDDYCKSGKCLVDTAAYDWLMEHLSEYGFILRYPSNKVKYTNISFEPWHLRYIGVEIATHINDEGITLEEWYAMGKKLEE